MGEDSQLGGVEMRIKPIAAITYTHEKDERHHAEERRIKLLINLLCEMDLPGSKVEFLKLKSQRYDILKWLSVHLAINNSHHKNFQQADNLIKLILKTARAK